MRQRIAQLEAQVTFADRQVVQLREENRELRAALSVLDDDGEVRARLTRALDALTTNS